MALLNPIEAGKAGIQVVSRNLVNARFRFATDQTGRFKERSNEDRQYRADRVNQQWLAATEEGIYEGHVYKDANDQLTTNWVAGGTPFIFGFLLPDDEYKLGYNPIYQIHVSGHVIVKGGPAPQAGGVPPSATDMAVNPVMLMGASGVSNTIRTAFQNATHSDLTQNDNLDIHYMSNKSGAIFHGGATSFDFRERWVEPVDRSGTYSGHKAIMLALGPTPENDGTQNTSYRVAIAEIRFSVWRWTKSVNIFNPDL